jgi:predicted HTH domain antitoxin
MEQTLTIKIPSAVQLNKFELSMALASKLYERGVLSSGQAADMVGISKRAFVELLAQYGVSVFGYDDIEDLKQEVDFV